MRISFTKKVGKLAVIAHLRDAASNIERQNLLKDIIRSELPANESLIMYFDTLIFLLAYPATPDELQLTEKALRQITGFLSKRRKQPFEWLQNSGLPYSVTITQFSHDTVRWLMDHPDCKVEIDSFAESKASLYEILQITLPNTEKHIAAIGLDNDALMDALHVPPPSRLPFIIAEFSRFDKQPQLKDTLFDYLGLNVCVTPKNKRLSGSYNRLPVKSTFYHQDFLSHFDHKALLAQPVPSPVRLMKKQKAEIIDIVKNAMLLTARETDPTTYMMERSLRFYNLERGISICIYGMEAHRQLPLESYVGYTVFKNGMPVAYGGAWIFGERAQFGINIFEPYRKGESGYVMTQLLRLYKNVFNITYFEVEPYQYGLDNPEGIRSGAFWFYYKYGFRPVDLALRKKATAEAKKIRQKKNYRTNHKTLFEFTGSNIFLNFGKRVPPSVSSVTDTITRMIGRVYKGNRLAAEKEAIADFCLKTGVKHSNKKYSTVLSELALWAKARNMQDKKSLDLMAKMVEQKPKDLYAYQQVLLDYFSHQKEATR